MKSFASDNYSGVHPTIFEALIEANEDHASSYGNDMYTEKAEAKFKSLFGDDTQVLFVFNGTGANVVCLQCAVHSFESIICAETAHICSDECGAPVKATGSMLQPIVTPDGKLTPELIDPYIKGIGNMHNVQPRVISISQTTEVGTLYQVEELSRLCEYAHVHGLLVHLDGARIANAVASLGVNVKACTVDCGVDIMSFGGTKNGLLMGEAILIFNPELARNAQYVRKQATQLFSKMRFISAQFVALFENDLWLTMARHSNHMAKLLEQEIKDLPFIEFTQPVEANALFVRLPEAMVKPLQQEFPFYLWDEQQFEARWMCSFDTTEDDIRLFVQHIKMLAEFQHLA
ncbi:aminotransferase class V-fold PLP-dependent enzyme [Microbacter margulisiae]|uniref:Threonine aldolase n=1 Tax=Microbacter margulisiae TaxID=1350067 RepID=A0A7W5H1F9_9PORP|nr:threonine aldolase [Microbacter margulisiae]